MVRYKVSKTKNESLLSARNPNSRITNTILRTENPNSKTNTVLRTENSTTNIKTNAKTRLRQKMKLLVYKKDGKFYIDNFAAYALKLTNVRAIMTGKQHLIEIGIETLFRFQNDEDIEIVYTELNKDKEIKTEKPDLTVTLDGLEEGKYGIGIHGIDKGSSEEKQGIADSISNEGLNINNNSKTILSTAISLGTNEDMQRISQEISRYKFGNGTKINVVIAVPLCIQNQNGERIFLGFPDQNKRTNGQQYDEHCILDRICSKMKKIPPQFILGYYCENQDGTVSFIKNGQHYSNLSPEDRELLFAELSSNMDEFSRSCNELIDSGNIEKLSQINKKIQQLGWKSSLVDNAITLAQNKGQIVSQNIGRRKTRPPIILNTTNEQGNKPSNPQGKNLRRVILNSPQNPRSSNSAKSGGPRKILVGVWKKMRQSDIEAAKETLREGQEEQKNCKGQEV